jgi:hypothetical protein
MDKPTLLEMTQNILSSMDSDEVNSINDTMESEQVALVLKQTYRALLSNRNWPHTKRLIQIEASGDSGLPTHMSLLDDVKEVLFVKYNTAPSSYGDRRNFIDMKWLEQDDFLRRLNHLDNTKNNIVTVIDPVSTIPLSIRNDLAPTYYTSFDDTTIVFDSFDSEVDSTLQKSKTQVYGYVYPAWEQEDDFIPDLPNEAFTLLQEEAKSRCFIEIKQIANQKAEQESVRQNAWLSRKDWRVKGGIKYPNYGRSPGRYKDPTFRRDD